MRTAIHGDGRLVPDLSPTAASRWERCPREWGHHYLDGLRVPRAPWLRRGELVHEVCEARLRGRPDPARPLDLDADAWSRVLDLTSQILELVPGRESGLVLEVESKLALFGAHARWEGRTDLVFLERGAGGDLVVVSDHKTTRDRASAKKPRELPGDPQGALYSAWACERWGVERVGLQWSYAATHGRRDAFPVRALVTRAEARAHFAALDERVGAPVAEVLRSGAKATDLEQTWRCDAYGGCAFRSICGERPATVLLEQILSHSNQPPDTHGMTLLERLRQSQGAQTAPAGTAPTGPYQAVNRPQPDGNLPPEHAHLYAAAQPPGQQHPYAEPPAQLASAQQPAQTEQQPQAQHPVSQLAQPHLAQAPVLAPIPASRPEHDARAPQHAGAGYVLLLGASFGGAGAPAGAAVHRAEDLIAAAHEGVRAACGVPDFRVVEYGHGKARLAVGVAHELARRGVGPGHFVVVASTRTDEWAAVGQELIHRAAVVVPGGA